MTRAAIGRLVGPPGARLHVVDRGEGPAVLLVHGFPGNLAAWRAVADRLEPSRRVVAVDLLGLGLSDRSDSASHAPSAHAARLLALLDELGIGRATVVGLSYGGGVAQWLAATAHDRVEGLVLVASVDASAPAAIAGHWRLTALAIGAGLAVPALARRVLALALRSEAMDPQIVTREVVDAYLEPLRRPGTRRALWAYGRDAAGEAPLDLGRIRAPTRILAGTADRIVPVSTARRLVRSIRGARLDEVPGGRHLLTWDRPDAIAAAILDA